MSRLIWDQAGEHLYETGVDRGVVYPQAPDGSYPLGVAWNGLTGVSESPSGADATALWADNIKYLNLYSAEEFGATIEAYTYPDEFAVLDGTAEIANGVFVGQQSRKAFGLSYRTVVGNDIQGQDYGYKLHLIYGAMCSPSDKSYETINDSPDAITFSWELNTTPVNVTGHKPTASLVIDSTKCNKAALEELEDILYGSENSDPRLPLPDEVAEIMSAPVGSISVTPETLTFSEGGEAQTLTATVTPEGTEVSWTSGDEEVATVANGVVTPVGVGETTVTATITVEGETFTDTCAVTVEA